VTETNVFPLAQPGTFTDSLTEVLRNGARALLARAVEAEVAEFLAQHAALKTRPTRAARRASMCRFVDTYGAKYEKALDCLTTFRRKISWP
jgi:hypothetical protein